VKVIAALLLLLAVTTPPEFLLEPHRAGSVRVGENVDALYKRFPHLDTELIDLKAEGFFTPLLKLRIDGRRDALRAYIGAGDRQFIVRGVEVRDPRFRTAAGIHVGLTLRDLRNAYKKLTKTGGEGTVGARVEALSMTFDLGGDVYDNPRYRARDLSDVPGDVPIVSIWIN
jgi:hypothetical protein